MHKRLLLILSILLVATTPASSIAQIHLFDSTKVDSSTFVKTRQIINAIPTDNFQKFIYKRNDKELPYRLLLPKNYNKALEYPLVITFHNSSRIGNDNEKQLEPLSKIWTRDEIYSTYNCFVIAPQFNQRSSNYTTGKNEILISTPGNDVKLVIELLDAVAKEYNIDKSRIYLMGYSMGASTAQNLMSLSPGTFAAMVSIAAVPDLSNLKGWKNKKIFLIHGQQDTENPYNGSAALFAKLKGNKNLVFKTFTNLDHNNINIPLLLSDEIPKWMFQKEIKKGKIRKPGISDIPVSR